MFANKANKSWMCIFLLFIIAINCLIVKSINASGYGDKMINKQVYEVQWQKISKLIISTNNYSFINAKMERRFWECTLRNDDGTSIRIINSDNRKAIIFNVDGSIRQIDLPTYYSWLDRNDNVIAWSENENEHHAEAKYIKGNPPNNVDPSGQYFIKEVNRNKGAIYSVTDPNIPLVHLKIIASDGLSLFYKEERLYVFGFDKKGLPATLKGFVYKKDGEKFNLEEEFEIPRTRKATTLYLVEDMSPWSDEILLVDFYDFAPFHKRYIFNLKTKKLRYYGPAHGEKCLFLRGDVIKAVEEKLK